MLIVITIIYFLPTILALIRGHLSALAIFLLNLFLGWTLIAWIIALIWACTSNTATNRYLYQGAGMPSGQMSARPRSGGSLWIVLIVILAVLIILDKRRDFRDVRSFDFSFPSRGDIRL